MIPSSMDAKRAGSVASTATSSATLFVASEAYATNPFGPGGTDSGTIVQSFNAQTGAQNALAPSGQTQTQVVETSDHGRFLYLASNGVAVEDTSTGKTTFYDTSAVIMGGAKSGDGNTLVFSDGANTLYAFDGQTGVPTRTYSVANSGPVAVDYAATRIYAATPARNAVTIVDGATGHTVATVALPGQVTNMAVNAGYHELFALAANDRKAYIVYLVTNQYRGYILEPTTAPMSDIALNEESSALYLAGGNLIARYLISNTGVPQPRGLYHLSSSVGGFDGLAVDRADQYIYALNGNDTVQMSASTGTITRTYPQPSPDPSQETRYAGLALAQ